MPTRIQKERTKNLPLEEVETLYKAGKSTRQIASIFGVSFSTIQHRLRAQNCLRSPIEANLMRYHGRIRWLIPYEEVSQLYSEGKTSEHIASLAGVAPNTVRAYLKKIGLLRSQRDAMLLAAAQGKLGKASGIRHYKWKGGQWKTGGYVYVSIGNSQREKRSHIVWEQTHGQPLPEGWLVHHLNGIKTDDSPENLFAMPHKSHKANLLLEAVKKRVRNLEAELGRVKTQGRLI